MVGWDGVNNRYIVIALPTFAIAIVVALLRSYRR